MINLTNQAAGVLQPGEGHIGAVGGQILTSTYAFTRPANTTLYTAKDTVGINLTVTDASNTAPIVITSAGHGLATGDAVTVAGVTGNTAANGDWIIAYLGVNTFSLNGSVGNGAYTGGGTVALLLSFFNIARVAAGSLYIVKARLLTDQSTNVARFRLHLYKSQVSAILDNAPQTLLWANRVARVGYIDFPACQTEGAGSTAANSILTPGFGNLALGVVLTSGTTLWGALETLDAFTPANGQLFYIALCADVN